jgi:hypothetical protein
MGFNEQFNRWYDRQSIEILFLLSVSPLILMGVILIVVALILG